MRRVIETMAAKEKIEGAECLGDLDKFRGFGHAPIAVRGMASQTGPRPGGGAIVAKGCGVRGQERIPSPKNRLPNGPIRPAEGRANQERERPQRLAANLAK